MPLRPDVEGREAQDRARRLDRTFRAPSPRRRDSRQGRQRRDRGPLFADLHNSLSGEFQVGEPLLDVTSLVVMPRIDLVIPAPPTPRSELRPCTHLLVIDAACWLTVTCTCYPTKPGIISIWVGRRGSAHRIAQLLTLAAHSLRIPQRCSSSVVVPSSSLLHGFRLVQGAWDGFSTVNRMGELSQAGNARTRPTSPSPCSNLTTVPRPR